MGGTGGEELGRAPAGRARTGGAQGRLDFGEPVAPPRASREPSRSTPAARAGGEGAARLFATVALDRPLRECFSWSVPRELEQRVAVGARVAVPLGARREVGVVVALSGEAPLDPRRLRPVARVLDAEPILGPELLELTRWIAREYACSWGEALAAALPGSLRQEQESKRVLVARAAPGAGTAELAELEESSPKQHRLLRTLLELGGAIELRALLKRTNLSESPARSLAKRGWIVLERVEPEHDPLLGSRTERARPERLSEDQARALRAIEDALVAREHAPFLLQGVTGSGKTEVYLRAIERALALGRDALVLVPEIALTPQTVGWFRSRFGAVLVLHSGMTDAQRRSTWLAAARDGPHVVVGARSAVFAPVRALGVVVLDEEHEPSFKQAETPRYHAREVALERARRAGAVVLLGSATPSLESWQAAREGRLTRLCLGTRIHGGALPPIEVVDMRAEPRLERTPPLFSRALRNALGEALSRGEQALLFRNRRGFSPVLWCAACKRTVHCPTCDVALTFHRRIARAVCHLCCEEIAPPGACPSCTAPALRYLGAGSERLEDELKRLYPAARVRRMDSDTMQRREDYERVLDAFGRGEIDLLVGTQMIAKGLDFPRVTVVGVVSADAALHVPDFRAAERTFQLLVQVAGRAGRGSLGGRTIVQTESPEHPAIQRAARHDFEGFAAEEASLRESLAYPPFARLVRVVLDDPEAERVDAAAAELAEELRAGADGAELELLGPAECPIARWRGRTRRHLLLKLRRGSELEPLCARLADAAARRKRPRVTVDVDPMGML